MGGNRSSQTQQLGERSAHRTSSGCQEDHEAVLDTSPIEANIPRTEAPEASQA